MESYVGKRIDGRYEIHEIIGVGGMAVVYKAYDNIDDRIVAVKILKEEYLANEEFRRRFRNEPKAIAVLSHPNIVKVYDVSFGDKLQYIVMDYIEGITLKEYIQQQGILNCKEIVHFTTQILKAIQHAHSKGIVHRDIKPQNILLLQDSTIKVTDFGIARFSRNETRTMSGSAIGSVHYISPEQARGEITDEKSDIYSVGVLMYEMLTGQLPFQSDSAVSVALKQVQEEAVPPSAINSDIPTGLEQITMKAMQKNPRDRYQSAAEMLMDIEEYKKNPSIIFDYSYLVNSPEEDYNDQDETEYVDNEYIDDQYDYPNNYDNGFDEEDDIRTGRFSSFNFKKYLPVLLGILAAALIVGLVVFFVVGRPGTKQTVPEFVGKNYETEIKDNEEYSGYQFEIKEQETEDSDVGVVLYQDPAAGSKYEENMKITLTIAKSTGIITVPDVYEETLETAQKKIKAMGLKVEVVLEYSDTVTEGIVIKTSPKRHETVEYGDTIKIYVSDPTAEKTTEVPDIIGSSIDAAKVQLEAYGLELDENYEEVESIEPAGVIVSCSPDVGEYAPLGSKITVKVSTGKSTLSTVEVSFKLPSEGSGPVLAKVNSNIVENKKNRAFDGSYYTIIATGTGNNDKLTIYVDDQLYYSCNINFTYDTPVVSGEINNCGTAKAVPKSASGSDSGSDTTTVNNSSTTLEEAPSYVTYYYVYAKNQLEAQGYTVTVEKGSADSVMRNMVESQTCNGKNVTLYVYQ